MCVFNHCNRREDFSFKGSFSVDPWFPCTIWTSAITINDEKLIISKIHLKIVLKCMITEK